MVARDPNIATNPENKPNPMLFGSPIAPQWQQTNSLFLEDIWLNLQLTKRYP